MTVVLHALGCASERIQWCDCRGLPTPLPLRPCSQASRHSAMSMQCGECGYQPGPLAYDRAVLATILTYHYRDDIKGCGCGWSVLGASWPEHVAAAYEEAITGAVNTPRPSPNRWGEPAGPDVPERGDHVQVRGGTTTGTVIAVERDEVWIVMDQPPGFLQSWGVHQLEITQKLIP